MKTAAANPKQNLTPAEVAFDAAADYMPALAAFQAADEAVKALVVKIERLERAIQLASFGEAPQRSQHIAAEVADLIVACRRSPLRAAADLESLRFDFADLKPKLVAARDRYLIARSAEATRIAETFRGRHLDATRSIITALEALNAALDAERKVRAEFSAASPEPSSCALPDMGADLSQCDLSRWSSQASQWARRIRELGVKQ